MEPDLLPTDEVAKSLDKPVLVFDVTDPSIKGSMIAGAAADSLFYYSLLFALAFQLSEDDPYRRRALVAALGPRRAGTRGHLGRRLRRNGDGVGRAVAGQRRPRREAPPGPMMALLVLQSPNWREFSKFTESHVRELRTALESS
jgi:hypothetical protein